jgi:anaerobic magnesium-protoporphyrin IX monomethyl ester cyclase
MPLLDSGNGDSQAGSMKILIVVPRFVENFGQFHNFPLGLGYIASALRDAGHEIFGLNLNQRFGSSATLVGDAVRADGIEVCATGSLSPFLPQIREILAAARAANPDVLNICGGGVVSSDPDIAPDMMDMDIGVVGEGEATIVEAIEVHLSGGDLAKVKGIVFKNQDGKNVRTGARPPVMDLTTITWPDYDVLGVEQYLEMQTAHDIDFFQNHPDCRPRSIDMISSRSCPFSCTFCFHPVGKVYRERPLDEFFAELEHLIEKYAINMVIVIDELFSLRKARLMEFCERIKKYNVQWMVQLHISSVDDTTLAAMHDSGAPLISFGVESMSQPVLDSMQKKAKKSKIEEALWLTHQNRIGIQGNLIFGDTAETLETANESMRWWAENRHLAINLSRLQVYPGSPDYIMAVKDGLIQDRLDFSIELPIGLNISNLNDANLNFLTKLAFIHRNAVLNPVLNPEFRVSERQKPGRDVAYDIDWHCPRCAHDNQFKGLIFHPMLIINPYVRLQCHSCRSRFDVENLAAGRQPFTLSLESSVGEGFTIEMVKDPKRYRPVLEAARRDLERTSRQIVAERAREYVPREFSDANVEFEEAAAEVGRFPFSVGPHIRFARILGLIGAFGAAALHLRQARDLEPENPQIHAFIRALEASDNFEEKSQIFVPSISDEPPPYRASRDTERFDRKKQPAFPVYSRASNRQSVVAAE